MRCTLSPHLPLAFNSARRALSNALACELRSLDRAITAAFSITRQADTVKLFIAKIACNNEVAYTSINEIDAFPLDQHLSCSSSLIVVL